MKILAQTSITPVVTVYDANNQIQDSPISSLVKKLLQPVVQVQTDDGQVLYSTGEFKTPVGFYILSGLVIIGTGIILYRMFGRGSSRTRSNPVFKKAKRKKRGEVKIYDNIMEIKAQKGDKSLWPGEFFKHKFTKKNSGVYGQSDGSLVIRGDQPLWKTFEY
jgi:hypothetical protein